MTKLHLHSNWKLHLSNPSSETPENFLSHPIAATVPGCVHTDLLAAGQIKDPYLDTNENELQWVGDCEWTYTTPFNADAALMANDHLNLVCEGLDTIAELSINNHVLGKTENMHLAYRFDIKPFIIPGHNELKIVFHPALAYAQEKERTHGKRPRAFPLPYNFIRKMACNFGWDWGPTLTTAGIWRPIYIQAWQSCRLETVRPLVVDATESRAAIEIHTNLKRCKKQNTQPLQICTTLKTPNGKLLQQTQALPEGQEQLTTRIEIADPERWWPIGHGEQPRYDLTLEINTIPGDDAMGSTQPLDSWHGKVGLRKVELLTEPDSDGTSFTIAVNGKQIFCKGANWIPDDCFVTRVTPDRYRERIQQAADANMNMLRVWGGGIYENEAFYSICDELGILVWQDFLFACAAYPEEAPFDQLVEDEARYQIARLSPHPSLVLWNGNNENLWGYEDWGWKDKLKDKSWGKGFYLDLLPDLMKKLDPSRPYFPGSPYSDSERHPLEDGHGCKHVWDAWNEKDYLVYRDYTPRFVSEFGHQGPPTYATLKQAIPESQWQAESTAMLHHQRASNGNAKLHTRLEEHFEIPTSFDDWMYVTQLNQARGVSCGVSWYRSRHPVCMGTLYWQHNDCWPVTSWAAVDGYGNPKLLWYATRNFYAARMLTIQPTSDSQLELVAINDSDVAWNAAISTRRLKFDATLCSEQTSQLNVQPRSVARIQLPKSLGTPENLTEELILCESDGIRGWWFFQIDKKLHYPEPKFQSQIKHSSGVTEFTINAQSLLRDIVLYPDRIDPKARVDQQLVSLLPGDSHTFYITSETAFNSSQLTTRPIFQCANFFGASTL